jgi:hypothetical protein
MVARVSGIMGFSRSTQHLTGSRAFEPVLPKVAGILEYERIGTF